MNRKIDRILSMLDFFAGLFFGVAVFGAYVTFQMFTNFLFSIVVSVSVFCIFAFLTVVVRYFVAMISLSIKHNEVLESIRDHIKSGSC